MFKRIGVLIMALVLVLTVTAAAFADDPAEEPATSSAAELKENGEAGVAGDWDTADTIRDQAENVNIKKEIKVYNPEGTDVHAPVITYTYTVTPATGTDLTVTDEARDHDPERQVTAPVRAGLTTGLVVTGTAAGAAGNGTQAVGTLVFTNETTWETAAAGKINEYDINLDFSGVPFTKPGVYRYHIAETVDPSYDAAAMEDGKFDDLWLDVYVDGELNVYGYVCMNKEESVTETTQSKINGFVDASDDGGTANDDGADKYYTYDLDLSKLVENDSYAEENIAFPFTVVFTNPDGYSATFMIDQTTGTGSTGLNDSAATLSGNDPTDWSGVALVKEGGKITLTGIPAGVDVEVYETNIVTGVTYAVTTKVTDITDDVVDDSVVSTDTTPTAAVTQGTSKTNDYESTAVHVDTPKIAKVEKKQEVEITNKLVLISPTGVVVRIAPYVLILAAGIALLVIGFRRKAAKED